MQIGTVQFNGQIFLAPMAGVTDKAFRQICREHGASMTITEMVSTRALCYQDKKTPQLLSLAENEAPSMVQIFGHEPQYMAEGAKIVREITNCDIIDINMGCPAPKIAGNGDGSALMKDSALAAKIVAEVKSAVDVPVTVKIRKGWDEHSVNCVPFAKHMEEAGADAIAVHGRTRSQQYSGAADWDAISAVKQAVSVPVIANGDVFAPEDGKALLQHTGADGIMIGRGAMGNPWIFERTKALLTTGEMMEMPPLAARLDVAMRQVQLAIQDKGEHIAMLEARRHVNYYLKSNAALKEFKTRICAVTTLKELMRIIQEIKVAEIM